MITIGMDPSSKKLAFTVLEDGDLIEVRRIGLIRPELADRLRRSHDACYTICNDFSTADEVYFWVEEPIVGRGGAYATILQSHISGAAMAGALVGGAKTIAKVYPSTWKAKVLGNGQYPKESIPSWVHANWLRMYRATKELSRTGAVDPDVIDSGCIARYGYLRDTGSVAAPVKKKRKARK